MSKQNLNAGESAQIIRTKMNQNFTELYEGKASTNHASSSNIYGVSSASMYGHIKVTVNNGLTINDGVLALGLATTSVAGSVMLVDNATTADVTAGDVIRTKVWSGYTGNILFSTYAATFGAKCNYMNVEVIQ